MKSVYEILNEINEMKTSDEKIQALKSEMSRDGRFALFIDYVFRDPAVEWDLDMGALNYSPSPRPDIKEIFFGEIRRLYIFTKDGYPGLTRERKTQLAIQLLESIDKNDAALLTTYWRTGKLRFRGISPSIVKKALGE